ncbi:MAG: hypothetical protein U0807_01925 [Candidatus Binatia bacterium]
MRKSLIVAALALAFGARVAGAACPVDPFGSDDAGKATCDKDKSKCEQKASKGVGKLVAGIIKCQTKLVDAGFKAKPPADEQACENAVIAKFLAGDTTACPCVVLPGISALAESVLNGASDLTYCDSTSGVLISSLPANGAADITGWVPATKGDLKCQDKVGKNVGKLVGAWLKCHGKFAADVVKTAGSPTFDEEGCEGAAVAAFNTANGALICPACQAAANASALVLTEAQLDGANSLTYCESPSGAFVQ